MNKLMPKGPLLVSDARHILLESEVEKHTSSEAVRNLFSLGLHCGKPDRDPVLSTDTRLPCDLVSLLLPLRR